jgi:hypothetical protein
VACDAAQIDANREEKGWWLRRVVVAGLAAALAVLTVPAGTPAGGQTSSFVALGDSFTAGPVIPNQLSDPPGCFRSDHNYPHIVAGALRVADFRDASCSGAGTENMTSPQDVNPGPDNPPQFDRLEPSTELVTVGIGGNDLGFSEIIENCATADRSGTPCQDHYVDGEDDELSKRIADIGPEVAGVLEGIRERSPDARVLLVNYVSILPETGSGCWPQIPFGDTDVHIYGRNSTRSTTCSPTGPPTTT